MDALAAERPAEIVVEAQLALGRVRIPDQARRRYPTERQGLRAVDPGHRDDVPDHLGPAEAPLVLRGVAADRLDQVVAQRGAAGQAGLQLRQCRQQQFRHPGAGKADQRHAAVEQDLGGVHILHQVEFVGVRPVPVVAAQPDDDDLVGDRRFQQQRGGDVGRTAVSTVL